jgi:hypothetical protein
MHLNPSRWSTANRSRFEIVRAIAYDRRLEKGNWTTRLSKVLFALFVILVLPTGANPLCPLKPLTAVPPWC